MTKIIKIQLQMFACQVLGPTQFPHRNINISFGANTRRCQSDKRPKT